MSPTEIEDTRPNRQLATWELFAYVTGWALLAGCFTASHDSQYSTMLALVGLFVLPGVLIFGAIGYAIGGRRLFRPAALCGTSLWILANVVPVIVVAR